MIRTRRNVRVRKVRLSPITRQVNEWRARDRFCTWLQKQGYVTIVRQKRKRKKGDRPSKMEKMEELVDVVAIRHDHVIVAMVKRQAPKKVEVAAFVRIPVPPRAKKFLVVWQDYAREPLVKVY